MDLILEIINLEHYKDGDTVNVFVDRDVLNGVEYRYYVLLMIQEMELLDHWKILPHPSRKNLIIQ